MLVAQGMDTFSISTRLNGSPIEKNTLVEYIWVDGTQSKVWSKTRVVKGKINQSEAARL